MKKLFTLLLVVCLSSVAAHAQLSIGGSIYAAGSAADKTFTLDVSPDLCYSFENLNVGVTLNLTRGIMEDESVVLNYGLTPYVQYYIWTSGIVSLLAEAGCSIGTARELEDKPVRFVPYVAPVLEVELSDHWCIQAGLGELSWDSLDKSWVAALTAKEIGLGVYYSF